jgi:hypothetical protein
VAAADTLAGTDVGIDKLLEGLAEPAPEDTRARDEWTRRISRYLAIAADGLRPDGAPPPPFGEPEPAQTLDPRLLEPSLALIAGHGRRSDSIRTAALRVLAQFHDERVAAACLPYLPLERFDHQGDPALAALRGCLGENTVAYLAERTDGATHDRVLHTLSRLVAATSATQASRDACAVKLRRACRASDADAGRRAAVDLLLLHAARPELERSRDDAAALLEFIAGHDHPGGMVLILTKDNLPGAGDALLTSYRSAQDRGVLSALAGLSHEPAADEVHREAVRRIAETPDDRWRFAELRTLPRLGARGLALSRPFLGVEHAAETRTAAAGALGEAQDATSFDAMLTLLDELESAAPSEEKVQRSTPADVVRWSLMTADPRRAYTLCVGRAITAPPRLRDAYAGAARTLLIRHPGLKDAAPSIRAE